MNRFTMIRTIALVAMAAAFSVAPVFSAPPPTNPTFEADVLPIFQARCAMCHTAGSAQKGLVVATRVDLLRGGESGPAIEPGRSGRSLLMDKISGRQMPPMDPKLTPDEVETIRRWIDQGAKSQKDEAPLVTEQEVLPIFQVRCVACHGKREQKGGLDLRTLASRLKGGKSGPAVVPGKPDESLIIQKLEAGNMPPAALQKEYFVRTPTDGEVATLKAWIAGGCQPAPANVQTSDPPISEKGRKHWAFQPPAHPTPPTVAHPELVRNPIDTFLLQKLEEKSLSYSAEAEPLTLLRRVYLDLTGMPPKPEEVSAYLNDRSADKYERLVDRLLDSPEYGERWARHWLDLAGYKDTEGYGEGAPVREFAWRYRDYVIHSLNSDKPYDKFLMEQIAGDEMADYTKEPITPEVVERLAATGFMRTAADPTWEAEFALIDERMNLIGDQVQILSSSLMGLTIGCAKCHDHKYDPISQRDYYRMSAILQSSYDPYHWLQPKDRMLNVALESDRKHVEEHNAPILQEVEGLEKSLKKIAAPYREKMLAQRLKDGSEDLRRELLTVMDAKEEERTEAQKVLAANYREALDFDNGDLAEEFAEFRKASEPLMKDIREKRRGLLPKPQIRALIDDKGDPPVSYLLRRGNPSSPGEAVEPGVPAVLNVGFEPYQVEKPWPGAETTGRRLALARWLTQPNHPLTSRVFVNQLWMRHFGRGIVATPDNFGLAGQLPSHPELLDWLATDFVDHGWSVKRMHRLMVTSTAYRQASKRDEKAAAIDPENTLLSRMSMKRLDAEQLYDTLLTATGRLNPERFGPSEGTKELETKEIVAEGSKAGFRRAIYVFLRSTDMPTLLDAYDFPEMSPNCLMRRQSNVSTQALNMMNGEQIWEFARFMAGRIIDDVGEDRGQQVDQVFLRALSRPPTESEESESIAAMEQLERDWPERLKQDNQAAPVGPTAKWLALAGLCHTMINSAEFLFVD